MMMNKSVLIIFIAATLASVALFCSACSEEFWHPEGPDREGGGSKEVTFSNLSANGSSAETTTQLTLSFSEPIPNLSASDFTLSGISGVSKGTLTGSNPYTLPIFGFSSGGSLNVSIAKTGYTINESPKTATIFYYNAPTTIAVTSVTLNTSALSLTVGGSETLTATVSPSNAANKSVSWSSSNSNVASVSGGTVYAASAGSATITVTTADGGKTATCSVTVSTPDVSVTFSSLSANGSSSQTTTQLTLQFSAVISGLSASDISLSGVSGVTKGTLSGSNPYTLGISGFTSGGSLSVYISKTGYSISGSPKSTTIYSYTPPPDIAVTFSSLSADGSSTETTTQLTLQFSAAISGLSSSDITLSGISGVTKGTLSGSNPYTLDISGFSSGGSLSVYVAKTGYVIGSSPKTVTIYYYAAPSISGFIRIEGGTFTMGSPSNEPERHDNEVQHQVTVSSFYMKKYEVTQAEYEQVMGTNPSSFIGLNLPVESVTWYDAVEYCNKLSQRDGLTFAYQISGTNVTCNWNANGYRLPTEAEWEYACRAGTTTPFNTGSNITTSQANYDGNHPYNGNPAGTFLDKTTTAGNFAPNAWGLYDMHGNVWEWCWDWQGDYSSGAQTNPRGPVQGSFRVVRGGSWYAYGRFLRSAYRYDSDPSGRYSNLGFRLVRP
ncbi:MAG: SUMF1/EgtB/PvdO family nonheme iron enzyme [Treponema sp.]|jgi:formylglycine-generating enzyme required for sulfatase activity|nr:SUMF1/EgtB/PvdO family nonheme iron enzyme [Treponema sp.]